MHLLGYPKTIEDTCDIDAARATLGGIRINDGSSVNDIGLWRPRTSRHRDWDARHVYQAARQNLILLLQLVRHAKPRSPGRLKIHSLMQEGSRAN